LERATHLKKEYGGGSITALPIIETQAENLAAYIPTNLISITDGQIYVSPKIFQMGNLPAVNIGASVSRVGGKTQLPAYRQVTSALKLTYSQFEELEIFASFSARLDDATKLILERGYRIRKILNQPQYSPMDVMEQIGVFLAVVNGALDFLPLEQMEEAEEIIRMLVKEDEGFRKSIEKGEKIEGEKRDEFLKRVVEKIRKELVTEG
jgi:F-type H+-transporting ATPase subunit alpha